ncbi:MAG: hypothetical protein K2G44_02235 [Clostridia bacterium]|nr:hypothetical protein [Clostridia bacterium]
MDEKKFVEFLEAAKADARVFYHYNLSEPFKEIIDEIYDDTKQFRYYTLDGRFQDIFLNLVKNSKYVSLGYKAFLDDLETELKKLIVPNIILLPLNFLDSNVVKKDLILNDKIRIFLPTEKDLIDSSTGKLLKKQKKQKKKQFNEPLCKYFNDILNGHLDKEHILLAKDRYFFKYPILTIQIDEIDAEAESAARFITEAVYSILRMIDYSMEKPVYRHHGGEWENAKFPLARTYTVYYNDNIDTTSYYGYSYGYNFSNFLDINSTHFLKNKDWFCHTLDVFIKAHFIDQRKLSTKEIKTLNKWCNSILLYNAAYELASIEKYDTCSLILCALMESVFINNKGSGKSEILKIEIRNFVNDFYSVQQTENLTQAIGGVYKYRNKIVHEGLGFEHKFLHYKGISLSQGVYRGMKPFNYASSFYPNNDLLNIDKILQCLVDILIGEKMLSKISAIVEKAH